MARVKTAVSLDKSLFEQIWILVQGMEVSRSRLFAMALEDFLQRHESEQLLRKINEACREDEPAQAEQARLQGMRRFHCRIVAGVW